MSFNCFRSMSLYRDGKEKKEEKKKKKKKERKKKEEKKGRKNNVRLYIYLCTFTF